MVTEKEKSLQAALAANSLQMEGLPKQLKQNGDEIWIMAIVLVLKSNLEECYCLYSRKGDGYIKLEKEYGSGTGIIQKVISIHPFIYLDKERFFPSMGYTDKRSLLKTELSDRPDEASLVDYMSDDQVDISLIDEGIRRQLLNRDIDMANNAQNEGNNLDGTNRLDEMEKRFKADLAEMKANGASKVDMRAFIDEFEKKKEEMLHPSVISDEDQKSWEDELREEMEAKDEAERKKATEEESVDGEFDVPDIDLAAVREATEQYRREQILISKRKFKRRMDGQDKFANGNSIINEFGEEEAVETLALPKDAADKQVAAMEKAMAKKERKEEREAEAAALAAEKAAKPRNKGGRPKGSKNKPKPNGARKTTTRKTTRRVTK